MLGNIPRRISQNDETRSEHGKQLPYVARYAPKHFKGSASKEFGMTFEYQKSFFHLIKAHQ